MAAAGEPIGPYFSVTGLNQGDPWGDVWSTIICIRLTGSPAIPLSLNDLRKFRRRPDLGETYNLPELMRSVTFARFDSVSAL